MDPDSNGFLTWESTKYAIWWLDGSWRIGPKDSIGTDDAKIVSISPQSCPYHFVQDGESYGQTAWRYEDPEGEWTTAELENIYALAGEIPANI